MASQGKEAATATIINFTTGKTHQNATPKPGVNVREETLAAKHPVLRNNPPLKNTEVSSAFQVNKNTGFGFKIRVNKRRSTRRTQRRANRKSRRSGTRRA